MTTNGSTPTQYYASEAKFLSILDELSSLVNCDLLQKLRDILVTFCDTREEEYPLYLLFEQDEINFEDFYVDPEQTSIDINEVIEEILDYIDDIKTEIGDGTYLESMSLLQRLFKINEDWIDEDDFEEMENDFERLQEQREHARYLAQIRTRERIAERFASYAETKEPAFQTSHYNLTHHRPNSLYSRCYCSNGFISAQCAQSRNGIMNCSQYQSLLLKYPILILLESVYTSGGSIESLMEEYNKFYQYRTEMTIDETIHEQSMSDTVNDIKILLQLHKHFATIVGDDSGIFLAILESLFTINKSLMKSDRCVISTYLKINTYLKNERTVQFLRKINFPEDIFQKYTQTYYDYIDEHIGWSNAVMIM